MLRRPCVVTAAASGAPLLLPLTPWINCPFASPGARRRLITPAVAAALSTPRAVRHQEGEGVLEGEHGRAAEEAAPFSFFSGRLTSTGWAD